MIDQRPKQEKREPKKINFFFWFGLFYISIWFTYLITIWGQPFSNTGVYGIDDAIALVFILIPTFVFGYWAGKDD